MFDITCILFAGGKSSRMGQDKALLPFGIYNTLAQYQYERLKKLFAHVYISAKSANKFDFDAAVIEDTQTEDVYAPTAGFTALFEQLEDERFFVLSVDTPFVGEEEIKKLLDADNKECDAVIAKTGSGSHPMCGIYHRSLAPAFTKMLQEHNHRLGMLLKQSNTLFVTFEEETPFANLNHPHEYEEALKKFQG
jgi:molybdopterin-guanine dinucleotide biosynthesis protein A